jgi:hypothetical protein
MNIGNILMHLAALTPEVEWSVSYVKQTDLFYFRGHILGTDMHVAQFLSSAYANQICTDPKVGEREMAKYFASRLYEKIIQARDDEELRAATYL